MGSNLCEKWGFGRRNFVYYYVGASDGVRDSDNFLDVFRSIFVGIPRDFFWEKLAFWLCNSARSASLERDDDGECCGVYHY